MSVSVLLSRFWAMYFSSFIISSGFNCFMILGLLQVDAERNYHQRVIASLEKLYAEVCIYIFPVLIRASTIVVMFILERLSLDVVLLTVGIR